MRITFNKIAFAASLALALASALSCSSDDDKGGEEKYAYCVFVEQQACITSTLSCVENGGMLGNACPADYSKPSSSSNGGTGGGSSSSVGGEQNITYGDPVEYEGETYQTVVIGTQTWFARNLNYAIDGSKCYDDLTANCTTYGKLYSWSTAMGFESSCNSSTCSSQINTPHRGICPNGWHIPTNAEWDALYRFVDGSNGTDSPYSSETAGKYLKATSGWNWSNWNDISGNGTDAYGFAALPGGGSNSDGDFRYVGDLGYWWCASEYNADAKEADYRSMVYNAEGAFRGLSKKTILQSVRCVKD